MEFMGTGGGWTHSSRQGLFYNDACPISWKDVGIGSPHAIIGIELNCLLFLVGVIPMQLVEELW